MTGSMSAASLSLRLANCTEKDGKQSPARLAQLVEHRPIHPKVAGQISGQRI